MNVCDIQQANLEASKRNLLRASLGSTEILCLTIALVVNLFFWFILKETRMLLHVSKMLIYNAIFADVVTILSRYFIAVNILFEEQLIEKNRLYIFEFLHDSSQMMINLNEGMIVVVCWLTINLDAHLGQRFLAFLSCLVIFVPWMLASTILILEWLELIPSNPIQIFYCALNIVCFLILLCMSFLGRINYRRQNVGNLLGKFQASVQIRTLRVMLAIACVTVIRTTVTNAVIIFIKYYLNPKCMIVEARNVSFSIDLTIALHTLAQPLFVVRTNQEMAKICRHLTQRLLHCGSNHPGFDVNTSPQLNGIVPSTSQVAPIVGDHQPENIRKPSLRNQYSPTFGQNLAVETTKGGKKLSVGSGSEVDLPRNALGQLLRMDNSQDEHFKQLLKAWS